MIKHCSTHVLWGYEETTTNFDVNHNHDSKRQKFSSNIMDDNEKVKEQVVLLKIDVISDFDESLTNNSHDEMKKLVLRLKIPKDKIFQTSQDCKEHDSSNNDIEEKKVNESETELGSIVVTNFDLNELPSDGFEDETN